MPGTGNNMPAGLTDSTTLTTASADPTTGVPAGTYDQVTHQDLNVTGHDCGFCHTQVGPSTVAGIQGREWAQAAMHASFGAGQPLVTNGTTARCSDCHLGLAPASTFVAFDHAGLTDASGSTDCSACHAWPGTGTAASPNWLGAVGAPATITVGGFTVPQPPAPSPVGEPGVPSLPHPTLTSGETCSTCHLSPSGGKPAIGYDHASTLASQACTACHEAGTDLLGTAWNGATSQGSGAGDSRPFTLASVVARFSGDSLNVTYPNHFYPVDCFQCHQIPAGNGLVTTGTAYTSAWTFPHDRTVMANPSTCLMCHVNGIPN